VEWTFYQRTIILLLAACAMLLAVSAGIIWFFLSGLTQNVAVLTRHNAETGRAWLSIIELQKAANMKLDFVGVEMTSNLDAIRDELHALNDKASVAAEVKPPEIGSYQQ
jgi:hypothetical protein